MLQWQRSEDTIKMERWYNDDVAMIQSRWSDDTMTMVWSDDSAINDDINGDGSMMQWYYER